RCSALSDRARDGKVVVLDSWGLTEPSTKRALQVLDALALEGKLLVVLSREDEVVWKSLRNLDYIHILTAGELNAYDVLVSDWVVFTTATLPGAETES
ncbi:MAG: large subunit ribosomal protein, partial [Nocardioidaceae bacterium]|nr:large subunit ribosomal protein [Nocardioidaceae bacterium]